MGPKCLRRESTGLAEKPRAMAIPSLAADSSRPEFLLLPAHRCAKALPAGRRKPRSNNQGPHASAENKHAITSNMCGSAHTTVKRQCYVLIFRNKTKSSFLPCSWRVVFSL
jgi:hypothetical protein